MIGSLAWLMIFLRLSIPWTKFKGPLQLTSKDIDVIKTTQLVILSHPPVYVCIGNLHLCMNVSCSTNHRVHTRYQSNHNVMYHFSTQLEYLVL